MPPEAIPPQSDPASPPDQSPSPSQWPEPTPQSPNPSPADGEGSESSSTGSPAGTERVAKAGRFGVNAGPAFNAEGRPAPPPVDVDPLEPAQAVGVDVPQWDAETVGAMLTAKGALAHGLFAVDPDSDEWRYLEDDLRAIAPPLARMLNRYEPTAAAAGAADPIAVAWGLFGYAGRSIGERREALRRLAEAEPVPITGRAAAPDAAPASYTPPEPAGPSDYIEPDRPPLARRPR